ncbi:MAG: 50S ribosomal protein L23 [Candidatus Hodarchaeaceae archaeon]|nr:50S ribosomal protein L23 [Candidatus Hodarchaeaceae archaeon]MDI6883629.1 50S ribosomal protein L23 [Hadesarchaea archaeon]
MKDPHKVLLYPQATEKVVKLIESENKLVFIVANDASKSDVKRAVETLFEVRVNNVKVEITPDGRKRAYVRLAPEFMADEIAAKLGMI